MRRSRTLTSAERLDVGLLMSLLVLACAIGALVVGRQGVPMMLAWAAKGNTSAMVEVETPLPATPEVAVEVAPAPEPPAVADYDPASPPSGSVAPKAPKTKAADKADVRLYNGKKFKYVRTLKLRVTAYAPDPRCCWPYDGSTTASGLSVKTNRGRLVAADTQLIPMHSIVSVPGYAGGQAVPVLDRGGKIQGHRLDILLPTFDQAKAWGSRILEVKCYEPAR